MGELRVITLHPCRVIRRSADRFGPVSPYALRSEVRIVEPAEILGNGVIGVAPRGDPAPQPLFQRRVFRPAVRGLVRIARIGALHRVDGEVEVGHGVSRRGLRPGRQQANDTERHQQDAQQNRHLFQRRA